MTRKRFRHIEGLKTAAIILLALAALLMILLLPPVFGAGSTPANALHHLLAHVGYTVTEKAETLLRDSSGAHLPLRLVWNGGAGRCGYQYGSEEIEAAFQPAATILGEAFGSARNIRESSNFRTRSLMNENSLCLYLDYGSDIPLSLLANWYGTEKPDEIPDIPARRVILAAEGDSTVLCLIGEGGIWEAETAVNFSNIESAMNTLVPNGAAFAFELDGPYENIYDYTLISGQLPVLYRQSISSPLSTEEGQQRLLRALGFNPNTEAQYVESDGTHVVVETESILRYSLSGSAIYRDASGSGAARLTVGDTGSVTEARVVSWAVTLFEQCAGTAERNICLQSIQTRGNTIVASFGYVLDGVTVRLAGSEPAMTITVTDGAVTQLELRLLQFTATEEPADLLPEQLAAAAAGQNTEPIITYVEEDGVLVPSWIGE